MRDIKLEISHFSSVINNRRNCKLCNIRIDKFLLSKFRVNVVEDKAMKILCFLVLERLKVELS